MTAHSPATVRPDLLAPSRPAHNPLAGSTKQSTSARPLPTVSGLFDQQDSLLPSLLLLSLPQPPYQVINPTHSIHGSSMSNAFVAVDSPTLSLKRQSDHQDKDSFNEASPSLRKRTKQSSASLPARHDAGAKKCAHVRKRGGTNGASKATGQYIVIFLFLISDLLHR
jgi:hypothetical protein